MILNNKFLFGIFAEYLTICLYVVKLYKIISHRMRNYAGEIDIIAVRGKSLVFIEVKARKEVDKNIFSHKQQNRIKNAAKLFLSKNPIYANYDIRFDISIVQPYKIPNIIENAW